MILAYFSQLNMFLSAGMFQGELDVSQAAPQKSKYVPRLCASWSPVKVQTKSPESVLFFQRKTSTRLKLRTAWSRTPTQIPGWDTATQANYGHTTHW